MKVYDGFSHEKIQNSVINNAVILAQFLGGDGFDDITADEVGFLIDAHSDPLTDQHSEELTKSSSEDEEVNKNEPEDVSGSLISVSSTDKKD